jgi:hypothetical protein
MVSLVLIAVAYTALGNDEYFVREWGERTLQSEFAALMLPPVSEIENPEIRLRVSRIKRKWTWYNFPDIVEGRMKTEDFAKWFWKYAFERRSLTHSDLDVRCLFCQSTNDDINSLRLYLMGKYPYPFSGSSAHLFGEVLPGELERMCAHFDWYNSRGQANRAIMGGMWIPLH